MKLQRIFDILLKQKWGGGEKNLTFSNFPLFLKNTFHTSFINTFCSIIFPKNTDRAINALSKNTYHADGAINALSKNTYNADGVIIALSKNTYNADGVIIALSKNTYNADPAIIAFPNNTYNILPKNIYNSDGAVLALSRHFVVSFSQSNSLKLRNAHRVLKHRSNKKSKYYEQGKGSECKGLDSGITFGCASLRCPFSHCR